MADKRDIAEFEFETVAADALTKAQRAQVIGLFDACYRQANHAYLEKSLARLRFVSLAARDAKLIGCIVTDTAYADDNTCPGSGTGTNVPLNLLPEGVPTEPCGRMLVKQPSPRDERQRT